MAVYSNLREALLDYLTKLVIIRARIFPDTNVQERPITAVDIRLIAPSRESGWATLVYRREIDPKILACAKVNPFMVDKVETLQASLDNFIGQWVNIPPWLGHEPVVFCQQDEGGEYKLLSINHSMILQDLARVDMWIGCLFLLKISYSDILLAPMHERLQGFLANRNREFEQAMAVLT